MCDWLDDLQFDEVHELEHIANLHHHKGVGSTGPIKVKAYRAGEVHDAHGRGVFFGHSHQAVSGYGQSREHTLHINNALHAPSHEHLYKHLFKAGDFHTAVEKEHNKAPADQTHHVSQAKVEARMAKKAHKLGHDAIIYTKPTFRKAGGQHGPEVAVIGEAAKRLTSSQHSEQFAEGILSKLRGLISTGYQSAIKRIAGAASRIRGLVDLQTDLGSLIRVIESEVRGLRPLLQSDLTTDMFLGSAAGTADVQERLPKKFIEAAIPAPSEEAVPEEVPTKGPVSDDLAAVLFPDTPAAKVHQPAIQAAVEALQASPVAAGDNYRATAKLVHQGAFAVTGDLTEKAVADVRDQLVKVIEEGGAQKEFIEIVATRLEEAGSPLSPPHLETIFRTNTMAAYSKAQLAAVSRPMVSDAFPYVARYATKDTRVRKEHWALESLGLNGTNIYRYDDPTYLKFRSPWDYNCRCRDNPVTVEQAARKGVKEAEAWLARAKEMAESKGGSFYQYFTMTAPPSGEHVEPPPFEPSPEFRRDPV